MHCLVQPSSEAYSDQEEEILCVGFSVTVKKLFQKKCNVGFLPPQVLRTSVCLVYKTEAKPPPPPPLTNGMQDVTKKSFTTVQSSGVHAVATWILSCAILLT